MNKKCKPLLSHTLYHHFLLCCVLVIASFFRMYKLGDVPYGVNQDEMSTAYDAFAIAFHGVDRMGHWLPLFLVSWGSGMQALPAYFLVPFYYVFGVSVATMRFCAALCGVASVFFSYRISTNLFSKSQGLLTGFLIAISPWHIMQSRWFFEAAFLPFFFLGACALYLDAIERKSSSRLFAASGLFSLCLYTYAPAYLFIPVFFLLCTILSFITKIFTRKVLFASCVIFAVFSLPLAYYLLVNSFGFPEIRMIVSIPELQSRPRYETFINTFSFSRTNDRLSDFFTMIRNQQDDLPYNAIPNFGVLYPFAWVFFIVGFGCFFWKTFKNKYWPGVLVFAWTFSALVLVSVIDVNLNRANMAVLLFLFVATVGLGFFCRRHAVVMTVILSIYSVFSYQFASTYFGDYQTQTGPHFFASFNRALLTIKDETGEICITDTVKMPYIYTLFYFRVPPHDFFESVSYENPGDEFQKVKSFDRFRFGVNNCEIKNTDVFLLADSEIEKIPSQGMSIQNLDGYKILRR